MELDLGKTRDAMHLFAAVGHPTRLRILVAFVQHHKEWSPSRLTNALPHEPGSGVLRMESLGTIAYHFRALEKAGLLVVVRERSVRGASEHFYRITNRGRRVLEVLQKDNPN